MPTIPIEERIKSFDEVNLGFSWKQALLESRRCLNCGAGAVVSDECVACFNCVLVCPYGVPTPGAERAQIDISQCQACGICASECPASAIDVKLETKEESRKKLKDALDTAKKEAPEDFTIEFYCQHEEPEGPPKDKKRGKYSIGKPCMARIDVYQFIHPFERGSKGVEIYKCERDQECRFKGCDEWIQKHIETAREMLKEIGIDADRIKMVTEKKK